MFEFSLRQVEGERARYSCVSNLASMDRVSSGSLVCSCDLYIDSGGRGI